MSFKILVVTATSSEADALRKTGGLMATNDGYRFGNFEIELLVTGVGSILTAWTMKQWISVNEKPDLAINLGIAGTYNDEIMIGDVIMPLSDCFADAGIEDGENFLTLFEAGFISPDEFPFKGGLLLSDTRYSDQMNNLLKPARAITVNTTTGSEITRQKLLQKFNPDIETMEGATFFYICAMEDIPFLAFRAISNKVEPRNKSSWDIPLALNNMSEILSKIFFELK